MYTIDENSKKILMEKLAKINLAKMDLADSYRFGISQIEEIKTALNGAEEEFQKQLVNKMNIIRTKEEEITNYFAQLARKTIPANEDPKNYIFDDATMSFRKK